MELKQRLEKRATFEAAVKDLTQAVRAQAGADESLYTLVPRVHTLLKARYSNPAFWKAGLDLAHAVEVCDGAERLRAMHRPCVLRHAFQL